MANTKATLYLDERMYRTFKIRAAETGHSVSELMNDALQAQLAEDLADVTTMRARSADKGRVYSYEEALSELRKDAII